MAWKRQVLFRKKHTSAWRHTFLVLSMELAWPFVALPMRMICKAVLLTTDPPTNNIAFGHKWKIYTYHIYKYIYIYMYAYLYIHNYIYIYLYVGWFLWNLIMSWLTCLAQSNLSLFPSTRSCKQSIFCTDWWKAKPRWSDAWEDMFGGPQSQWLFISKIQQSMQWNPSGTASAQSRLERGRKLTDGRWRLRLWIPKDWEHIWKRWLQGS